MANEKFCVTEMNLCQLCGHNMQSCNNRGHSVNYQKQVDPPAPMYGSEYERSIPEDPLYHPPEFYASQKIPLIVHTPCLEYRVTSDFRGKPANQTGVLYIMNHSTMGREDVEAWISKKKRMAEENLSWVGDGTYVERRPNMLHFFGNTTHMFMPNPDKPFGNSPRPLPICRPRDGLDH